MLATIADAMPTGDEWVFEPKYDGIRILAGVSRGEAQLFSRNAVDRTADFPDVASAVLALATRAKLRDLVLDGELVARTTSGIGRFQDLQQRSRSITEARRRRPGAVPERSAGTRDAEPMPAIEVSLMAFDLLAAGDDHLITAPWHTRHDALVRLFRRTRFKNQSLQLVTTTDDGRHLLDEARRLGWEGVIAKRTDSVYEEGHRSHAWRKLKLEHTQEFVIGGYTEPRRSREHIGALLLGHYRDTALVYAGLCGGGFTQGELTRVAAKLRPLTVARSPFAGVPPRTPQPAHWVKPALVAQVRFTQWTADGKLRHPVYLGLRDDKRPVTVHREPESIQKKAPAARSPGVRAGVRARDKARPEVPPEAPAKAHVKPGARVHATPRSTPNAAPRSTPDVARLLDRLDAIEHETDGTGDLAIGKGATLTLSHLDKVFYPKTRTARAFTKGDLCRYYVQMASAILPAIADHPLVLRRFPNGITGKAFYQHKAPDEVPRGVRTADVEAGGNVIRHLIGGDLATLVYLVQLGAISVDPWHSRVRSVASPDYTIIDLDPGTAAPFGRVVEVATWVEEVLDEFGLHGVPKTSGMSGLHIVLPLVPGTNEDAARVAAELVATTVAERHANGATVTREVRKRGPGQVYVDFLQNIRGKTVAGAYAARPHPLAQVSMPLAWDEVTDGLTPAAFTIETAPARLAALGDLWAAGMRRRNDLAAIMKSIDRPRR
jgi:bifunctional non-homologous end joining protein LigD